MSALTPSLATAPPTARWHLCVSQLGSSSQHGEPRSTDWQR